jgi:alcohol dehydrogenase class IV
MTGVGAFTYDAIPGRVVFGAGSRHSLVDEAGAIGARRILLVASSYEDDLAADVADILGDLVVGRFSDVVQHVPVAKAAAAVAMTRELDADTIVTIGGGSSTGFGKAIALDVDVRQIALPTTYAGSEMTTIYGLTDGDHKQTGKSHRVKPDIVVYDPELTLTLPPRIAGPSGMNALAHCVEALYGPGANPVISVVALEGMRALHRSLPTVCEHPDDLSARTDALYGAYLAGVALATGGTALHHKTCHVLGGMFDLNHGDMNAVVLGHAVAYNAPMIPELMDRMGEAIGSDDVAGALHDLAAAIGAPTSLREIGMPEDGIGEAARRIVVDAALNVRAPEPDGIRAMLHDAFVGQRPG